MSDKIYYKDSDDNIVIIDRVDYEAVYVNLAAAEEGLEYARKHNNHTQSKLNETQSKLNEEIGKVAALRRELAATQAALLAEQEKNKHNQTWANALLDGVPHVMIRPSNARFKSTRFRGDFIHCVHCGTLSNTIPRMCCTVGNADDALQGMSARSATKGTEDVQKHTSPASDTTPDC